MWNPSITTKVLMFSLLRAKNAYCGEILCQWHFTPESQPWEMGGKAYGTMMG